MEGGQGTPPKRSMKRSARKHGLQFGDFRILAAAGVEGQVFPGGDREGAGFGGLGELPGAEPIGVPAAGAFEGAAEPEPATALGDTGAEAKEGGGGELGGLAGEDSVGGFAGQPFGFAGAAGDDAGAGAGDEFGAGGGRFADGGDGVDASGRLREDVVELRAAEVVLGTDDPVEAALSSRRPKSSMAALWLLPARSPPAIRRMRAGQSWAARWAGEGR